VASGLHQRSALGLTLLKPWRHSRCITHFEAAQRGVLELRALVFYVGFIAVVAALNAIWVSARKGG
jgi:ABC-2 type transport system permease protein